MPIQSGLEKLIVCLRLCYGCEAYAVAQQLPRALENRAGCMTDGSRAESGLNARFQLDELDLVQISDEFIVPISELDELIHRVE